MLYILLKNTKKRWIESISFFLGSPKGTRTPDTAVKGRCLNHLTMGPRGRFARCNRFNRVVETSFMGNRPHL